MCDPISASIAVVSAGAQVGNFVAQSQQASSAAKTGNARYASVATAAMENYRANLNQLYIRSDQQFAADTQTAKSLHDDAAKAIGTVNARAGAAGVSGASVNALMSEFASIEAENAASLQRQQLWNRQATQDQAISLRSQVQQRLTESAPTKINGPSPFGLIAGLAGTALSVYGFSMQHSPPPTPKT